MWRSLLNEVFLHEVRENEWFHGTYERLPLFCFLCGVIGHGEVKCLSHFVEDFVEPVGNLPYGAWLRAPGERPASSGARLPLQETSTMPYLNLQLGHDVRRWGQIFDIQKENRPKSVLNENIQNLSGESCGDT